MKRRRFLATSGIALLGGCTFGDFGGSPTETPTATPVPSDESTGTPSGEPGDEPSVTADELRERRVVEFETAPLTVALYGRRRINGRVTATYGISEPATAESPAVVHALVENGGGFERTVALRRIPGFWNPPSTRGEDGGGTVYLAPTENHDLAESVPEVRRDEAGRWRLANDGREWLPERLTLEPDEAVLGEYYLVASDDADDSPLVADEYRFLYQGEGFTVSAWETDAPGPEEGSTFEDPQVPPLPNAETMAWYHEADARAEVYLQPSEERVEAPACIEFELHNRSGERIAGNPYDWTLYKLDDGEWFRIAPWFVNQPLARIPPGNSDESELSLFHGEPMACEDGRGVGHLGGGRYAYRVGFGREGETHAALLDLEAPAVSPTPDDDAEIERDGDEVVVTTPVWNDEEHPPDAELVFERTDRDPDRRLVAEQLFRRPMRGYRNALPLFEDGVEQVVLRTDRHVVSDTVDYDELEATVAYGGQRFHVEGEDPLRE
ncbi:hypothetical protein BRD14_00150 [Halobacteriales archaeon SW_5_68_122]|nr:MAG: hypothetical protein BRD14_00150 [Halobacteriales archaeon SW_5_68_122]